MSDNFPKIIAHRSAIDKSNFVTQNYIVNSNNNEVNLFHRFCPHRRYPLAEPGEHVNDITCKFHNFKWNRNGIPINNTRKINCGAAQVGKSNLIFKEFEEPAHKWVKDLENERNLKFSHTCKGSSKGSWLWMMDIQTDLLHIYNEGIHPELSKTVNLETIGFDQGKDWVLQEHPTGWWLCIYPFTFIEWSAGCLGINTVSPIDPKKEFGFSWITQFYFDDSVSIEQRSNFETLETVFHEDVDAIEKISTPYFPIMNSTNRLEYHCIHWGNWVKNNIFLL